MPPLFIYVIRILLALGLVIAAWYFACQGRPAANNAVQAPAPHIHRIQGVAMLGTQDAATSLPGLPAERLGFIVFVKAAAEIIGEGLLRYQRLAMLVSEGAAALFSILLDNG